MAKIMSGNDFFIRVDEIAYMSRNGKSINYFLRGNQNSFTIEFDSEKSAIDTFEQAMKELDEL